MPNLEVVSTAKPEDTTGPRKPSEEEEPELVDVVTSGTLLEKRRMVTEQELQPQRWSKSECDDRLTLGFISIYGIE
jgi:hypothetical protein